MIELLKKISKSELSGNEFLLCLLVQNKRELSPNDRTQLLSKLSLKDYQKAIERKYIKQEISQNYSLENLEITEKFLIFVDNKEGKISKKTLDDWFEEWYDLFPKRIKSGGYSVRTNPSKCRKNLRKFIKEHPNVDAETILSATKLYVDEFALKGYAYMKLAPYFVYKDNLSILEDYCERVLDDEDNEPIGVGERQI